MANAYTSWIIDAPVERVWEVVRDFNGLPNWNPGIVESEIEGGLPSDMVGSVRSLRLADGAPGRERLLALDDRRYHLMYNFELPPLPLDNYIGRIDLKPFSDSDRTLAIWHSTYDEHPENQGLFKSVLENDVFAGGFRSLSAKLTGSPDSADATRWQNSSPAKVYHADIIDASIADAWRVVRAFAGVGEWHPEVPGNAPASARSGRVGEQRTFELGADRLTETLLGLSDHDHRLHYSVRHGAASWLDYDAAVELHPVTMDGTTLVIWTIDWPSADATPDSAAHKAALKEALSVLRTRIAPATQPSA